MSVIAIAACSDLGPTAPPLAPDEALRSAIETRSFDGNVRIGVVPSATEVTIGAPGSFTLTNRATGGVLRTGSGGEVLLELETAGTIDTRFWLQVACTGSEATRDAWLAEAQALGYETYAQFVDAASCWRLLLGTLEQGWGDRVAFRNQAIADGLAESDSWWNPITIISEEPKVRVSHEGWTHMADGPVVLTAADNRVKIDGRPYRGVAEVWTNSQGTLAGINILPLDEYLYGVVPRELPPGPWPQLEAQKAQAVAARTFALSRIGHRAADGYDLLPTTADQVYGGYESEHPLSSQAVDETAGVVVTYNGNLISTVYHSTSGGFTADNEDVWASGPVAYLRGVRDGERRGPNDADHPTENEVRRMLKATSDGQADRGTAPFFGEDQSQYHRWAVEWTAEEMARVAGAFAAQDVGTVHEVNVLGRSSSGRASRLQFVTDAGTFTETNDQIRWALQRVTDQGTLTPLYSTLFVIEPYFAEGEAVRQGHPHEAVGFRAWGGGWGHGVGMSQTGAAGMAERGRTFDEILRHYYTGIELETRTY